MKTLLANQINVPEFNFSNALMAARYQNHLRRRIDG